MFPLTAQAQQLCEAGGGFDYKYARNSYVVRKNMGDVTRATSFGKAPEPEGRPVERRVLLGAPSMTGT